MSANKALILFTGVMFTFFCLCPYISVFGLQTTTQPNALLFSIFPLFLIRTVKIPIEIFIFLLVAVFATLVLLISDLSFLSLRDWANYVSLVTISLASYKYLVYSKGLSYKFFFGIVVAWLAVGLIQTFVMPNFLSFLFSKMRGSLSGGRGVTGLSTEPTYYGLIMALFFVIYLMNKWYKKSKLLGAMILFQCFFLSKSSTAIAMLAIAVGGLLFFQILQLRLKIIVMLGFGIVLVGLVISQTKELYKGTRINEIVELVVSNPEIILAKDYSVAERVNHMVFPVVSLYEGKLFPYGYGKFGDYLSAKREGGEYKVFFSHNYFNESKRILSGHGKGYFELGFFGLVISFGILSCFLFSFKDPVMLFSFILYFLLLFAALPFMTATVPFLLGMVLFLRHKSKIKNYEVSTA
jgi:hypothetical protein